MATKTISLILKSYEKLKAARHSGSESFSEVVLCATSRKETVTAQDLLRICRERGPLLTEEMLEQVERLKWKDEPPEGKGKVRDSGVDAPHPRRSSSSLVLKIANPVIA